jgi:hypothetical protein
MPASSEDGVPVPTKGGTSSTNRPAQQSGPAIGGNDMASAAAAEKTISCVSCRKRKLKCDRIKPKCGTCSRLRHECEYPERRRNLGSKRRNMKELEARLGISSGPNLARRPLANVSQPR